MDDIHALKDDWTSLLGDNLYTDPDHFLWALESEPHVVRPHVLTIDRRGVVETLVAARVVEARLPCKLGHRTLYAPSVRAVCVMHDGLLGRVDDGTVEAVLDELQRALDRREADVILFRQLERDSPLHRAVMARSTFASRRQHLARSDVRWQIDLPTTRDAYLASLSAATRKGIRRTASRIEEHFGDRLSIGTLGEPSQLDAFLDEAEVVAARTYQRRLGVGYQGDDRERTRLRLLAQRGWVRGYMLYLDGTPIAFELGEVYRGRFHSLAGAYDPDFGQYRVGAYLLFEAITDLASDPSVVLFDFGFGDAEYKSKLGNRRLEEGDVVLYARRLRPLAVSVARTAVLEGLRLVVGELRRAGLLARLKNRIRRPIAPAPAPRA